MTARRIRHLAAVVVAVLAVVVPAAPAHAFSPAPWYYVGTWRYGHTTIPWSFTEGFVGMGIDWELRATNSTWTWNDLHGGACFTSPACAPIRFEWQGVLPDFDPLYNCSPTYAQPHPNALHVGTLTGTKLGVNYLCEHKGENFGFQIVIDPKYMWYAGTASPGGLNDLQSTITHEFGHATGWGPLHFQGCSQYDDWGQSCVGTMDPGEAGAACGTYNGAPSSRSTMCSQQYQGDYGQRTLENSDRQMFYGNYPKINTGGVEPPDPCHPVGTSTSTQAITTPTGTPVVC